MKRLLVTITWLALLIGSSWAFAVPPSGSGGGYYGSAWYSSNQGSVVGPYPTYGECSQALNDAVNYKVTHFGWSVVSFHPCHFNPPYPQVPHELSAAESLVYFENMTGTLTELHERMEVERYETAVCRIVDPDEDEDFDADERAKCVAAR